MWKKTTIYKTGIHSYNKLYMPIYIVKQIQKKILINV